VQGAPELVSALLDGLVAGGLVESVSGAFRLTGQGAAEADELMAADREQWGVGNAGAALDGFVALDRRMKETVTAWQLKETTTEPVINDHTDAAYEAGVLARLAELHDDASAWLGSLILGLRRLAAYRERLEHAMRMVHEGDGRYVASPRVDSYHGIWFELHEDLIRLAGRERAAEVAAGRA